MSKNKTVTDICKQEKKNILMGVSVGVRGVGGWVGGQHL